MGAISAKRKPHLSSQPSFDIKEIERKAMYEDDYDI